MSLTKAAQLKQGCQRPAGEKLTCRICQANWHRQPLQCQLHVTQQHSLHIAA